MFDRFKAGSLRPMVWRTLIAGVATNMLGLVTSILLSRSVGPHGRGEIAAALLWPGLLIYLGSMGLIVSAMYFTSLPNSRPQLILSNSIALGLVLSCIALPLGFVALPWLLRSQTHEVVFASRWYLAVVPLSLL